MKRVDQPITLGSITQNAPGSIAIGHGSSATTTNNSFQNEFKIIRDALAKGEGLANGVRSNEAVAILDRLEKSHLKGESKSVLAKIGSALQAAVNAATLPVAAGQALEMISKLF